MALQKVTAAEVSILFPLFEVGKLLNAFSIKHSSLHY